jgi:hypothetical protein
MPATCLPDWCFCEAIHLDGYISQPANTFSAIFMMLFGVLVWFYSLRRKLGTSLMHQSIWMGMTYGLALMILGIGTFYYHMSLTFFGQWADIIGMYFVSTYLIIYIIAQNKKWKVSKFLMVYFIINIFLAWFGYSFPDFRRWLFGLLLIYGISQVLFFGNKKWVYEKKWLQYALVSLFFAVTIWILDITKSVCDPKSWLQGHALWHVLTGFSGYCGYHYLKSAQLKLK